MLNVPARARLTALIFGTSLLLSACSPSLSPLYRDYQVPSDEGTPIEQRVTSALAEAGWDTVGVNIPNAITTEEKTLSNWGIYKVTATLEVTPLGQDHVRVYVHPYRHYITGGKGKIPYLTPSLRSKFLTSLNQAFRAQGLAAVGTPIERDEESTKE